MKQQKNYIVIIEPTDESIAWFFLSPNGNKDYQNTLNANWNHIPSKEEINSLLGDIDLDYDYHVLEPSLSKTKKHDFNVREVDKGSNRSIDNELAKN